MDTIRYTRMLPGCCPLPNIRSSFSFLGPEDSKPKSVSVSFGKVSFEG